MDQAQQLRNIIKANEVKAPLPTARVITVTSGKGGVGKSNVSVNLAIQFRKMGKKVIIFDADFGLANVEVMFGAVPKHNLSDLIYHGKNIKEIITTGPMDIGFISGGSGIASLTNLGKEYINYLILNLAELDTLADVIIIDTGAGISDSVLEFLVASKEILLVTTPEPASITDSYSLLKALNRHQKFDSSMTKIKVVANKTEGFEDGKLLYSKLSAVVAKYLKLPLEFVGVIPSDQALVKAVMQQSPVSLQAPSSKSALAFEDLAKTLTTNSTEPVQTKRGMAGFFSSFITKHVGGYK